jgi:pyruvate,water dikinase
MTPPQTATRTHRNLICRLAEATDERLVGGKARNLAQLIARDVPVPEGFVLTTAAFNQFLERNDLLDRIDAICRRIDMADPPTLQTVAASIGRLVSAGAMPPEIVRLLRDVSSRWPSGTLLVTRSSAVGEDGAHASFAGQLDSVLGLADLDLGRGTRTCWASYWSARALSYRAARSVKLDGMGVIVQRQVDARVSGVLFSQAPSSTSTTRSDDLMIEYCAGLGDGLVSGQLEPGRLIVSRSDWAVRRDAALADPDSEAQVEQFLTPRRILDLCRLALRIEKELGAPQDIEWSIDLEGQLWILQSRPITTGAGHIAAHTTRTIVWSNANVNENFPEPISPLLYSIASTGYYHYFRNLGLAFGVSRWRLAAMEQPLRGIIGVHGGRMYYNLTNIHAVLRMAPFGERLAAAFNQFVGATENTAQANEPARWSARRNHSLAVFELLRMAACTTWQYVGLRHRVETFEKTADAFAARTHPNRLRHLTLPQLLEELRAFVTIRNDRWKNASLADTASMVCYALLQSTLKACGCGPAMHNRLLRALPGVPSSIPPIRLWELSRIVRADARLTELFATEHATHILHAIRHDDRCAAFRRAFEQFLEDWGFRSSAELMLTVPSLQEDPLPAVELLKQYAATDGESPVAAIAAQSAERLAETSRLLRQVGRGAPAKAAAVWLLVRWTQRAIAYRERARLKQALLYTRCRRIALAIGDRAFSAGLLHRQDDIFMLTRQEIDELGSGRAMFPYRVHELVELRRREQELLAAMHPPDTIRLPEGEYLHCRTHIRAASDPHTDHNEHAVLPGTGACGGRAKARAAVLTDVRQAHRLERGDVLVTRQTDPGWGPVFCLISGLVIERGGMLSHGAIIAREFGLPCVVGVKDATRRIPHGAHVTIDGDLGICTIDSVQPRQIPPAAGGDAHD